MSIEAATADRYDHIALGSETTPTFRAIWMTLSAAANRLSPSGVATVTTVPGGWRLEAGDRAVTVPVSAVSLGGGRKTKPGSPKAASRRGPWSR